MTHAIVLIEAERTALPDLGGARGRRRRRRAYSVTGEWDFVAIVACPRDKLADTVTGAHRQLEGVTRTQTLVAFEALSRHDLEALFDIGA